MKKFLDKTMKILCFAAVANVFLLLFSAQFIKPTPYYIALSVSLGVIAGYFFYFIERGAKDVEDR